MTGRVERGVLKAGEQIEIVGIKEKSITTVATSLEMFRKILERVESGDNAGILLRGIGRESVERGMVCAKPGSIKPHTQFQGEIYVLTKEEGGRHTPFFDGYRPQFYFRTTDVTGNMKLPEGVEMIMPGDRVTITAELIQTHRYGRGSSLRSARRWTHRGCWRSYQGHRLAGFPLEYQGKLEASHGKQEQRKPHNYHDGLH